MSNIKVLILFFLLIPVFSIGQYYDDEEQYLDPINDPSALGQRAFVDELLWMAGYVPEKIEIYQTLPNNARVYRVKLDSVNGGFIFVRWDKKKKEHYSLALLFLFNTNAGNGPLRTNQYPSSSVGI